MGGLWGLASFECGSVTKDNQKRLSLPSDKNQKRVPFVLAIITHHLTMQTFSYVSSLCCSYITKIIVLARTDRGVCDVHRNRHRLHDVLPIFQLHH